MRKVLAAALLFSLLVFGCVEELDKLEKAAAGTFAKKPECSLLVTEDCTPTPLPPPPGAINASQFREMVDSIPERNRKAREIEAKFRSFIPKMPDNVTDLDECQAFLAKQFDEARKNGERVTDENRWYNMLCSLESDGKVYPAKIKEDEIIVKNIKPGTSITAKECVEKYDGKEYRQDRKTAGCAMKKTACLEAKRNANVEGFTQENPKASKEEITQAAGQSAEIYCQLNEEFEKALKDIGIESGKELNPYLK